jgi:hypothetical protein
MENGPYVAKNILHIEAVRERMDYTEQVIEQVLVENGWDASLGDDWRLYFSGQAGPYCYDDIWARACTWGHTRHSHADHRRIAAFATTVGWLSVPWDLSGLVPSYPHGLEDLEILARSVASHASQAYPRPMEETAQRDFTSKAISLLDVFVWGTPDPKDELRYGLMVRSFLDPCNDEEKRKMICDELFSLWEMHFEV